MPAAQGTTETFEVFDGHLIRKVVPQRGRPYEHRCLLATLEQVAHEIDDLGDEPFTLKSLCQRIAATLGQSVAWSQAATALAFLRERGIVMVRNRRNVAATHVGVHLDAMTEYHALAEGG